MDIIKHSDTGETLSQIGCVFGINWLTTGAIIQYKVRNLQHVKGSASIKSIIITKQRSGTTADMEKLILVD